MIPPVIFWSVGAFTVKKITEKIVAYEIESSEKKGVREAHSEVLNRIKAFFVNKIITIFINIISFCLVYYLSPIIFSNETAIFILCIVYFSSIIHFIVDFIVSFSYIKSFIIDSECNLKEFIQNKLREEVRPRVRKEFSEMGLVSKFINSLFGKSENEITSEITSKTMAIVWTSVVSYIMLIAIVLLVYVIVFRLWVLPILMSNTIGTDLNFWQTLVYPFVYTIDYIFSSSFKDWVV